MGPEKGGAGGDVNLEWMRRVLLETAREQGLHFRLALIHAEQSKDKVRFYKTPTSILRAQLAAYDQAAEKKMSTPLFKDIVESQKKFALRAVKWEQDYVVNRRMAYEHYWAPNAKKPI